jgi:Na+/phosphate symporter
MTRLRALFAAVSAIALFLYGLQSFSRELQTVGGTALQAWLGRVTASRWPGFAVGVLATAIVQSSGVVKLNLTKYELTRHRVFKRNYDYKILRHCQIVIH